MSVISITVDKLLTKYLLQVILKKVYGEEIALIELTTPWTIYAEELVFLKKLIIIHQYNPK